MGGGAILNVGYKTMLRAERTKFLCLYPSLVTFWGYINRKRNRNRNSKFI